MFEENKSLSSTKLFERIWVTSFGGTGENPVATRTTAAGQAQLARMMAQLGQAPLRRSRAKGKRRKLAAKTWKQMKERTNLAYLTTKQLVWRSEQ